jgi:PTS system nitrogen regulatory IIA component
MQLNVREAAKILNVSEKTIYRWINQGNLPAYRVNEQYRFNRAELLEWATSRKINVSPEIFHEPESKNGPLVGLYEALQAGGIFYRVGGTDKEGVLRAVVETMRLPEEVDREFLFRVLLAREALGSTGVGDGIAIPHVRNPIVLHVSRPTITLCFLEKPVYFSSIDGKPVHTLFSLISPTVRAHLHLLSRLAFVLRDPELKANILRQASRDEILKDLRRLEDAIQKPAALAKEEEK